MTVSLFPLKLLGLGPMERAPLHLLDVHHGLSLFSSSDTCNVWTHRFLDQTVSYSIFSRVRYLKLVLWSQALVTMFPDGVLLWGLPIFLLCFSSFYTRVCLGNLLSLSRETFQYPGCVARCCVQRQAGAQQSRHTSRPCAVRSPGV